MYNPFRRKPKLTAHPNTEEIVRTVLSNHPKDCIFTPDAYEAIMEIMRGKGNIPEKDYIDTLSEVIKSQEIYCPHDGIDRR